VVGAAGGGCRPREKVHVEPVETTTIASVVHTADPNAAQQLVRGFHEIEQNSWRWTMGKFSIALKPPPSASGRAGKLTVNLSIPDAVIGAVGPVTLSGFLDGKRLAQATYASAGEHTFEADVPAAAMGSEAVVFDFELDKYLKPGTVDSRELGLVVSRAGLDIR
jgi:hypothetical protein